MIHKAIKGFEDYLITDTGRVYSLKSGKYLKACKHKKGYLLVNLCKNGKQNVKKVHRLVAEAFILNPHNFNEVDHINRVRDDNRAINLRWANRKIQFENMDHTDRIKLCKEKRGIKVYELVNEDKFLYLSLREVPNISHEALARRIRKGETDFTIKQRNGNVRHFKVERGNE